MTPNRQLTSNAMLPDSGRADAPAAESGQPANPNDTLIFGAFACTGGDATVLPARREPASGFGVR